MKEKKTSKGIKTGLLLLLVAMGSVGGTLYFTQEAEGEGGKVKMEDGSHQVAAETFVKKETVYSKIKTEYEIVSLSGEETTEFLYDQTKYNPDLKYLGKIPFVGEKLEKTAEKKVRENSTMTYHLTTHGKFKLGIDMNAFELSDIQIEGTQVKVNLPPIKLIALEEYYDKAEIEKMYRLLSEKEFSVDLEQEIHRKARLQLEEEIMSDEEIQRKARESAENNMESLILQLQGVESVTFD